MGFELGLRSLELCGCYVTCIEGFIPNAAKFKDGAFGNCLDHEGSKLINELIH
jgi:hypothetical protein